MEDDGGRQSNFDKGFSPFRIISSTVPNKRRAMVFDQSSTSEDMTKLSLRGGEDVCKSDGMVYGSWRMVNSG